MRADVAAEVDVAAMVAFEATFGGLDVLVNNAGGAPPPHFPDAEPSHWQRTVDVNLRGVMLGIHFGLRAMRRRGGAIVNISSVGGIGFLPYDLPEYGAAKAGVVRLTASLGSLHPSDNVRVNCICPGWVDTPASRRSRAALTPAQRERLPSVILRPDQIADAVVILLQDETLAGRVMIWEEGSPWRIVPADETTDEATAVGRVAWHSPGLGRSEARRRGDGDGGKAVDPIPPIQVKTSDINETGSD